MAKSTSVKSTPTSAIGPSGQTAPSTPAFFDTPSVAVSKKTSHPLNEFTDPSLTLVRRLEKWKSSIALIYKYAESHAVSQSNFTTGLEKTRKIFHDQPHLFDPASETPKSGIDETIAAIYHETEGLVLASDTAATAIRQTVMPPLEVLLAEVDQHHREIKENSLAAMKDIEKLRITTFKHMEALNSIVHSGAIPSDNREDPYVLRRQMASVLTSQVGRENEHARNIVAIQTNFAKFDAKVVQTIQTSLISLEDILTKFNEASITAHKGVADKYGAVPLEQDWEAFQAANKSVFLPTSGFQRDPAKVEFENMDHEYTRAVVEGPLNRKGRVLRGLQLGFYVLTPSGFLHEFKSEDAIKDPAPELSLFVPECEIEPLDPQNPDELRIHGKDRNTRMATRRKYVFKTSGDATLWYDALHAVTKDITHATAAADAVTHGHAAAAYSPPTDAPRGFASVSGTMADANRSASAGAGAGSRSAGAGVAAGAGVGAAAGAGMGVAAAGMSSPASRSRWAETPPPNETSTPTRGGYDASEVESLKEPNPEYSGEGYEGFDGSQPLAATTAATAVGISPRLRAQSPFTSYRNTHEHAKTSGEHVDDIAPMSLEDPVARKLDLTPGATAGAAAGAAAGATTTAGGFAAPTAPVAGVAGAHPYSALTADDPLQVDYDVGQAVGLAGSEKEAFAAHGYGVNGLGKTPAALDEDELQKEANDLTSHSAYQTSGLTGHMPSERTVFTEPGEPVVHETADAGARSGPYFSEPAGEPMFTEMGSPDVTASQAPPASSTFPHAIPERAPERTPERVREAVASAVSPIEPTTPVTPVAPVSGPPIDKAQYTMSADSPSALNSPPTPPTYAAASKAAGGPMTPDLEAAAASGPAAMEKTVTNSSASTKSKFGGKFMSKLRHGFKSSGKTS